MKILVTGATGFVGRHLIPRLRAAGHAILAASRTPLDLPGVEPFVHGDLAGDIDWTRALGGVDAVVHLAGLAHAADVAGIDEVSYERVNRDATVALAKAANAAKLQRFVFVSSIRAQTGPVSDRVLTERDEPQPTDAYGRSKLAAEDAVLAAGVPAVILRPVLVYGRGVKGNMATLVRLARLPVPLPVGALRNRRSLLSVDNLGAAIEHALTSPACVGQRYVVADPAPVTFPEIIAALRSGMDRRPGLIRFPAVAVRAMVRISLGRHAWSRIAGELVVDPSKLIEHGWNPGTDTRRALAELTR